MREKNIASEEFFPTGNQYKNVIRPRTFRLRILPTIKEYWDEIDCILYDVSVKYVLLSSVITLLQMLL